MFPLLSQFKILGMYDLNSTNYFYRPTVFLCSLEESVLHKINFSLFAC